MNEVQLIECPRDAMQGITTFIPTEKKVAYINKLLRVGFHTIDFGSFVSPKAIPQLADTEAVLEQLDTTNSHSRLLAIVANERGAEKAVSLSKINVLGYPFSISETFLQRNINSSIDKAWEGLKNIKALSDGGKKELVVYISMAFGNPYGDAWSEQLLSDWTKRLYEHLGIRIVALSDTVGSSTPDVLQSVFSKAMEQKDEHLTIGAHLHSLDLDAPAKIEAAYNAGCRRFDSALGGYGGCPMAADDLTSNLKTELVLEFLFSRGAMKNIEHTALQEATLMLPDIFPN